MPGKIQVWIIYNNGNNHIRLPVNPESIRVSSGYTWEDIDIAQLGEASIPKGNQPLEFTLTSFFPRFYNQSYCEYSDLTDPWELVKKIGRLSRERRPVQLVITGTAINHKVTIRNFQYEEKAGSPGDVYFTLDLKEYIPVSVRKVTQTSGSKNNGNSTTNKPTPRPSPAPTVKVYVVKKGDCLSVIAQRLRSQGYPNLTWQKLYEANKSVIGKNPNLIYPGQRLVIPK